MDSYIEKSIVAIERVLRQVKPELMQNYGVIGHELKDDLSAVTELDKHVETILKDALRPLDESVGFYGEEFGREGNTSLFWTIDPIDGTEAFIRGVPFCTNMLCLISNGQPKATVIYNFVLDELYIAVSGKGATLNGAVLSVSSRKISHAAIEYETKAETVKNRESYHALPSYLRYKFAASGFGFCQVAKGSIEARVVNNGFGKVWDYAPGALLVKEAGGRVANIGKDTYDYTDLDFVASNQIVFDELMAHFS